MNKAPTPGDMLLSVQCRLARLAVCHAWTEIARGLATFDGAPPLKPAELSRFATPSDRGWSIHTVQRLDRFLQACARGEVPLALSRLPPGAPDLREQALLRAAGQAGAPS